MMLLLAEDDALTREGLADILSGEGYDTAIASDGEEAIRIFRKVSPDLVILDIMMPKVNGYDVCKAIRARDKRVPVLFLSAKSEEIDKVLGLELGADDYISKPFGVKELVARVRAAYRRYASFMEETVPSGSAEASNGRPCGPFCIGDVTVYPSELRGSRGGVDIDLSLRDVRILSLFAINKGKVLDRDTIYSAGWGEAHLPNSRTLDQHISQLRKKIEQDPKNPVLITTVHTAGYRYP